MSVFSHHQHPDADRQVAAHNGAHPDEALLVERAVLDSRVKAVESGADAETIAKIEAARRVASRIRAREAAIAAGEQPPLVEALRQAKRLGLVAELPPEIDDVETLDPDQVSTEERENALLDVQLPLAIAWENTQTREEAIRDTTEFTPDQAEIVVHALQDYGIARRQDPAARQEVRDAITEPHVFDWPAPGLIRRVKGSMTGRYW